MVQLSKHWAFILFPQHTHTHTPTVRPWPLWIAAACTPVDSDWPPQGAMQKCWCILGEQLGVLRAQQQPLKKTAPGRRGVTHVCMRLSSTFQQIKETMTSFLFILIKCQYFCFQKYCFTFDITKRCQFHQIRVLVPKRVHTPRKIKKFPLSFCCCCVSAAECDWSIAGFTPSHRLQMKTTVLGSSLPHCRTRAVRVCCVRSTHTHRQKYTHSNIHLSGWLTCSSWLEYSLIPLLSQMDSVFLFSVWCHRSGMLYMYTHTHTHTLTHTVQYMYFCLLGGRLLCGF